MAASDKSSRSADDPAADRSDSVRRRAKAAWRRVLPAARDAAVGERDHDLGPVSSFPSLVAELRHCRWTEAGDIVLEGWSYLPTAVDRAATVAVFATAGDDQDVWRADVDQRADPEIGAFSSRTEDLTDKAWTATFPAAALGPLLRAGTKDRAQRTPGATSRLLRVWVELDFGTHRQRSPLSAHYRWGSAAGLPGRVVDEQWWTSSIWQEGTGLLFRVQTDCVITSGVRLDGRDLVLRLGVLGSARPRSLQLVGDEPGELFGWPPDQRSGDLFVDGSRLPTKGTAALSWTAEDGSTHRVLACRPRLTLSELPRSAVTVSSGPDGGLALARRRRLIQLEDVQLDPDPEPALVVTGAVAGEWVGPLTLELRGKTTTLAVAADLVDGRFRVALPMLHTDQWGNSKLAPAPGGYRLWASDPTGGEVPVLGAALAARLYEWPVTEQFNARLEHHPDGGLWVMVNDSRPLVEIGPAARRQLRARYASPGPGSPIEQAVYFESFDGLVCACNPKAVYEEFRTRDLGLTFYWGVKDRSVPAPPDAVPVTINSAEWWRVRHQARYLVANNWVHDTWTRHPHQKVLQTWHGTTFKRLALDRPQAERDPGFVAAVHAEKDKWDLLLAENAYSIDVMRQAYDYRGPILESGYPRNDLLTAPAADQVRHRLRDRLSITADQQVVLYAPTWRDNQDAMFAELDLAQLAAALGDGFVVLARSHSRTLRSTAAMDAERVIDVSSYPDISDLFCAADLCLTDYSSVMFDFTVTGKPVLFFAPDYDRYVHSDRGSYFDLRECAPGPVLARFDETVEAISSAGEIRQSWDAAYREWVARFNAWDDGRASARAVDALLSL